MEEYDVESILDMYEDDYVPESRPMMAGGGQLVQPNADGSRPGYSGLPDFITKSGSKINPYRVKVKKSKLNPEPFSGTYPTLKKAKEVVKEKGFKKGKTGVEYPELLEKAQNVVNDFNEIVDSAIANNDLRNVKYLETYVKDRFKNKSEQDQVLRQIYKKKIPYRDLTEVRKVVAKNLVNEAMKKNEIVPLQFVYDKLGASRSAQLTSDIQQIVSKGLKNQTKIKVDRAIESVVKGDMIIDDSLMKTVGKIIGRTQFGTAADTAWKQAFKQNPYYKKHKKLLDYAFTAGAKRSRTPGLSIQEILDDAKYKIGGGVTFSGKQTQFSGLKRYIFDYAKSHWHRNNFDGNPEKSLIEFYDKNGKPITWKSGLKLKLGEVQFKIPSESDIMWSYNGKPKGSVSVTGPAADASGIFNEVTDQYNVIKEISDAKVTHPITGEKTNYNDLVKQIYKKYGYTGQNVFGLDLDHFKGVAEHPFKNLRAMDRRLNISLGAIDRTFKNRNLKSKLKKELLGDLSTATGSNYSQNLKNYFVNQASTILEKGAPETLATKSPYYQAVKNVYEQKNLPLTQKSLLEKSYQRATKLENDLLTLAGKVTDKCNIGNAEGGRIGFASGRNYCLNVGKEALEKGLKTGFPKNQQVLAEGILKAGRSLKDIASLRGLLGPAALAFTAVAEAGFIGYDMLSSGKSFKEAVGGNLFNYLLGDKTKVDLDKEIINRLKNLPGAPSQGFREFTEKDIGKMQAFKSGLMEISDLNEQFGKLDTIQKNREALEMSPEDSAFSKGAFQLDKQEDLVRENIQDFYRSGGQQRLEGIDYGEGAKQLLRGNLLAKQDQLLDAGIGKFYQSPKGDERRTKELIDTRYQLDKLQNPTQYDEFGEYFMSRPPSEQSYLMGLGYSGGGIATLQNKKKTNTQKLASVYKNPGFKYWAVPPKKGPASKGLKVPSKQVKKV